MSSMRMGWDGGMNALSSNTSGGAATGTAAHAASMKASSSGAQSLIDASFERRFAGETAASF
jgi:hypothetical protein